MHSIIPICDDDSGQTTLKRIVLTRLNLLTSLCSFFEREREKYRSAFSVAVDQYERRKPIHKLGRFVRRVPPNKITAPLNHITRSCIAPHCALESIYNGVQEHVQVFASSFDLQPL